MKRGFNIIKFISRFLKFSPRQGKNELWAADFIISVLKKHQISYSLHKFITKIPLIKKATLIVDSKKIKCKGCSFVSGKINNKDSLVSSLIPSRLFLTYPNINFNPKCPAISLSNFYFAPALATNKNNLVKILKSQELKGEVKVEIKKHNSLNILVGNVKTPKILVFTHYDSIETGATDNASGVAVLMKAIISNPETLKYTLYIFIGNEELSFDKPIYWGHGFRAFEERYKNLMEKSQKILIVDCVGNGKTSVGQDKNLISLAFPIKNIKKWKEKIFILYGDIEKLMTVYHSEKDTISQLKNKYLIEAVRLLIKEVSN